MTKSSTPRYLTKSRFKQALDCPTKLFYTKKREYVNNQQTDTFLESLAQGGFQVEELARMNYPEGISILDDEGDYDLLVLKTEELLAQENVTIFEAAFLIDGLFIRVDILDKKERRMQIITDELPVFASIGGFHNIGFVIAPFMVVKHGISDVFIVQRGNNIFH